MLILSSCMFLVQALLHLFQHGVSFLYCQLFTANLLLIFSIHFCFIFIYRCSLTFDFFSYWSHQKLFLLPFPRLWLFSPWYCKMKYSKLNLIFLANFICRLNLFHLFRIHLSWYPKLYYSMGRHALFFWTNYFRIHLLFNFL